MKKRLKSFKIKLDLRNTVQCDFSIPVQTVVSIRHYKDKVTGIWLEKITFKGGDIKISVVDKSSSVAGLILNSK